jgi:hypothetical protein
MQLNGMGDTSWSDVLNNVVSQLPNLATGYATYELTKTKLSQPAATTGIPNYSPLIPTSYSANYSPAYGATSAPAAAPAQNNTMLYIAIGGAALLLVLALTSRGH